MPVTGSAAVVRPARFGEKVASFGMNEVLRDYCSLFLSEEYWRRHFQRTPPVLIGAGLGLALGEYYIGPEEERPDHPTQHATAAAYTRKDMSAYWTFYGSEKPAEDR